MTEEDWTIVLRVFAASRSRRGDKGRNDRKFLEALHYFVVHNITWRAFPEKFGRWNSVWKRFWRLSRSGTFEAFFDALAAMSETAHLVQMFDSTVVRAHVSAAGAKGGSMIRRLAAHVAVSLPRIHLKTDFGGLPIAFHLTGGEASDSRNFETLSRHRSSNSIRAPLSATKGYGIPKSKPATPRANAEYVPAIPYRSNTKDCARLLSEKHSTRHGHALNPKLSASFKRFSAFIALRCEKTAQNSTARSSRLLSAPS